MIRWKIALGLILLAMVVMAQQAVRVTNTPTTVATQPTGTNLHVVCDSGCSSSGSPSYGAAFPSTGTPIGFRNGSGNLDYANVDASHNLDVNIAAGLPTDAADNATVTTNPVPNGCVYQSSPTSLTNGQVGYTLCDTGKRQVMVGPGVAGTAAGGVLTVQGVASMTPILTTSQSGSTTAVTQSTASNLNAAVVGTGTAGSPAGNILTVQGVGSMTPLLTTSQSGSTTAVTQTTASNLNATVVGTGTFAVQNQGKSSSGNAAYENCDNSVIYDANTPGKTQLVALSSGKKVYVCGLILTQSTTTSVTVSLGSGTGMDCVTTYTAKTPAWPIVAQTAATFQGFTLPNSSIPYFSTAASEELCISTSAGVSVQALVIYGQH